jgi:hypothetical protein
MNQREFFSQHPTPKNSGVTPISKFETCHQPLNAAKTAGGREQQPYIRQNSADFHICGERKAWADSLWHWQ